MWGKRKRLVEKSKNKKGKTKMIILCVSRTQLTLHCFLAGNLQQNILNVVDFYSFGSCQYMIDWLPTITIEFLHRVKDCETLHSRKAKSVSGKISVDTTEIKGQIRRTVYVNVSGSHQPFNQDDGLILSWNKSKAIFYATIQDLIGKD